jgi:glycosyltransferase involved in cell wall biosynthesis
MSVRVLSLSWYGADLARGSRYSGALMRQKDYAERTSRYVVLVPKIDGASTITEGTLSIIPCSFRGGTLGLAWTLFNQARRMIRQEKVDVIMVDSPFMGGLVGLALRLISGIPLVVHSMADMPWNPWYVVERRGNRLKQMVMEFVIRRADVVRVSTSFEAMRLAEAGIKDKHIVVMPFYIDEHAFAHNMEKASMYDRDYFHVVTVARLAPQKDLETLLRAVVLIKKQYPSFTVSIVGDGPERARLRLLSKELGVDDRITFHGAVSTHDIARHFKRASIFVSTSLYEGTCMVLHEAALARLAVVSTSHAGARECVCGVGEVACVNVRDHRALARSISDILSNRRERDRMADMLYATVTAGGYRASAQRAFDVLLSTAMAEGENRGV